MSVQPDDKEGRDPPPSAWWRSLWKPLVVAIIVALFVWLFPARQVIASTLGAVERLGAWGPALLVVVYILACVILLPGSVLTIAAGFFFGLVQGTAAVVVGSVAGASAAFWIGRTFARSRVEGWIGERARFQAIDRAVAGNGFKIVLLTRLSPVFPFNFLNYAFGVTQVRFRDYLLGSLIGMFPGTVMFVYFGTAAESLSAVLGGKVGGGWGQNALLAVGLIATVAVTVLVTRTARAALADTIDAPLESTEEAATGLQEAAV